MSQLLDVNNWAMSQKLPIDAFKFKRKYTKI